jgi:hypothetical protein
LYLSEMVWGEKEEEDYDPYNEDEDDEKKDKWRPLLADNYPYMPERTMYSYDRPEKIAMYVNLLRKKKGKKEPSGPGDGSAVALPAAPTVKDPTHIGLYLADEDGNATTLITEMKVSDEEPVHEIEFTKILEGKEIENPGCGEEQKFVIAFVSQTDGKEAIVNDELYPHLLLWIGKSGADSDEDDDDDDDDSDDWDDYYDSDEDSEEDSDEEDDDDDEEEGQSAAEPHSDADHSDADHSDADHSDADHSDADHSESHSAGGGDGGGFDYGDVFQGTSNPLLGAGGSDDEASAGDVHADVEGGSDEDEEDEE